MKTLIILPYDEDTVIKTLSQLNSKFEVCSNAYITSAARAFVDEKNYSFFGYCKFLSKKPYPSIEEYQKYDIFAGIVSTEYKFDRIIIYKPMLISIQEELMKLEFKQDFYSASFVNKNQDVIKCNTIKQLINVLQH